MRSLNQDKTHPLYLAVQHEWGNSWSCQSCGLCKRVHVVNLRHQITYQGFRTESLNGMLWYIACGDSTYTAVADLKHALCWDDTLFWIEGKYRSTIVWYVMQSFSQGIEKIKADQCRLADISSEKRQGKIAKQLGLSNLNVAANSSRSFAVQAQNSS